MCGGVYRQSHEVWSTEEETHLCPGHFWICKFGTVPGSRTSVEKKFDLETRNWEEYKDTRYYDGDKSLVVELWLHRVGDDLSGLTFQEWDPSTGTDDGSVPVEMFVKSSELRAVDFHLEEVSPLQLDTVAHEVPISDRRNWTNIKLRQRGSSSLRLCFV